MTTYERLTMAIDYLQANGLARFRLEDENGARCIQGALCNMPRLEVVGKYNFYTLPEAPEIVTALRLMGFGGFEGEADYNVRNRAADWNNHVVEDVEDVIARLEAARDKILHAEANKAVIGDSPTGRLTKSEPAIQALPGTPAHVLEMAIASGNL